MDPHTEYRKKLHIHIDRISLEWFNVQLFQLVSRFKFVHTEWIHTLKYTGQEYLDHITYWQDISLWILYHLNSSTCFLKLNSNSRQLQEYLIRNYFFFQFYHSKKQKSVHKWDVIDCTNNSSFCFRIILK